MENLFDIMKPQSNADGKTLIFMFPLGDGAIPFIVLNDFARYVDWLFAHPEQSSGMNLHVATTHASGLDIAEAFTAANPGKTGVYRSIPVQAWHDVAWANLPNKKETKVGFRSVNDDRALLQTYEQNFSAWWNLYQNSAGNMGVIVRDYEMLDQILPERVKSVEEWMLKEHYDGRAKSVLRTSTHA